MLLTLEGQELWGSSEGATRCCRRPLARWQGLGWLGAAQKGADGCCKALLSADGAGTGFTGLHLTMRKAAGLAAQRPFSGCLWLPYSTVLGLGTVGRAAGCPSN
jgi:hypothetical protein